MIWALGSEDTVQSQLRPHLIHWDGTTWRQTPLPDGPAGFGRYRIVVIGPGDSWTVGEQSGLNGTGFTAAALHWDGQRWQTVPLPNVGRYSRLFSVAARATDDVCIGMARTGLPLRSPCCRLRPPTGSGFPRWRVRPV
jgi:hypothetical protein